MDFSSRTDALAEKLGLQIAELPSVLGFSRASLFNYRSGKTEPTLKALKKLAQAEAEAGLGKRDDSQDPMISYLGANPPPSTVNEPKCPGSDDLRERVRELEDQVTEMQRMLIRLGNRIEGDD